MEYSNEAPQAKWGQFLIDVALALDLQAIEGVYTENEAYYVARVSGLREGGRYVVRPTENSALTRSLTVDKLGQYPAWAIVDRGRAAREELRSLVDRHVKANGPLPPAPKQGVSLPWVERPPEEPFETAAQIRAAAAAKEASALSAKERLRQERKAARAVVRCGAAVQHIIRPDSIEGLFQGLDFLTAQVWVARGLISLPIFFSAMGGCLMQGWTNILQEC